MRGDDEDVRLLERPEIQAVLAESDLGKRMRKHAVVMTSVFRRFTPMPRLLAILRRPFRKRYEKFRALPVHQRQQPWPRFAMVLQAPTAPSWF